MAREITAVTPTPIPIVMPKTTITTGKVNAMAANVSVPRRLTKYVSVILKAAPATKPIIMAPAILTKDHPIDPVVNWAAVTI